jgi:hypothetical protein
VDGVTLCDTNCNTHVYQLLLQIDCALQQPLLVCCTLHYMEAGQDTELCFCEDGITHERDRISKRFIVTNFAVSVPAAASFVLCEHNTIKYLTILIPASHLH